MHKYQANIYVHDLFQNLLKLWNAIFENQFRLNPCFLAISVLLGDYLVTDTL
jgi:hypothetical protein